MLIVILLIINVEKNHAMYVKYIHFSQVMQDNENVRHILLITRCCNMILNILLRTYA